MKQVWAHAGFDFVPHFASGVTAAGTVGGVLWAISQHTQSFGQSQSFGQNSTTTPLPNAGGNSASQGAGGALSYLQPTSQQMVFLSIASFSTLYAGSHMGYKAISETIKKKYFPWVQNPVVAEAMKKWEEYRDEHLTDEALGTSVSPEIKQFLDEEVNYINGRFFSVMGAVTPTPADTEKFVNELRDKKEKITDFIGHCRDKNLTGITIPRTLRIDNPVLLKSFVDWETFKKNPNVQAALVEDASPEINEFLGREFKSIERQFQGLASKADDDAATFADGLEKKIENFLDFIAHCHGKDLSGVRIPRRFGINNLPLLESIVDWEVFKKQNVSAEKSASLPAGIQKFLNEEIKDLETLYLGNTQNEFLDIGRFANEVKDKADKLKRLISHISERDLSGINIPDSMLKIPRGVSIDHLSLLTGFIDWEVFKKQTLSEQVRGKLSDKRRDVVNAALNQVDAQFEIILNGGRDAASNPTEFLGKVIKQQSKIKDVFVEWENFKKTTLTDEVLDALPPNVQQFMKTGLDRLDGKLEALLDMNGQAGQAPDCATELNHAKKSLNFWLTCWNDLPASQDKDATPGAEKPIQVRNQKTFELEDSIHGIADPILVREFMWWEKFKQHDLCEEALGKMPARPAEHARQAKDMQDRDFHVLLYQTQSVGSIQKSIQQLRMKRNKIQKYLLGRTLEMEESPIWVPKNDPNWTPEQREKAKAADQAQLKSIFAELDKLLEEYVNPELNNPLSRDLLKGFALLDTARSVKQVSNPDHKTKAIPEKRRWTKDDDWHVYPEAPTVIPNLIYWILGAPSTGKGRLDLVLKLLQRTNINLEIPNILQGGVAALMFSKKWDALLQFDFPTSDEDDVGLLILQHLAANVLNPIWKINEPDTSDQEGLKKLLEPFLKTLISDSVRSEFPCSPSVLLFSNWVPLKKDTPLGDEALRKMEEAAQARSTFVGLNKVGAHTVEQDTIEAYRTWAYFFCSRFENGAEARLTPEEQDRLQKIFKDEAFDQIISDHREIFEGSRMYTHVPAIIGQIVNRLLDERFGKAPLREGETKEWVKKYYARYKEPDESKIKAESDKGAGGDDTERELDISVDDFMKLFDALNNDPKIRAYLQEKLRSKSEQGEQERSKGTAQETAGDERKSSVSTANMNLRKFTKKFLRHVLPHSHKEMQSSSAET